MTNDVYLGHFLLGPNDTLENGIYHGDARLLASDIPDESVDLIFTDPVYQNIDDYRWLAETAVRVLKPGGNLVAQTGHYRLPAVLEAMNGYLDWVWLIAEHLRGTNASLFQHRIICKWKPYVWYSKGPRMGRWVFDYVKGGGRSKSRHAWEDAPEMFVGLIDRFTELGGAVLDPFTGSATVPAVCKMLGRKYLAFEIEADVCRDARQRVRDTQPPLPGLVVEQLDLLPP